MELRESTVLLLASWLVVGAVSCTDYDLNPDVGDDDTVEPPTPPGYDGPGPGTPVGGLDCDDYIPPATYEVEVDEACAPEPHTGTFTPVLEWQWSSNPIEPAYDQVLGLPVVGNLTDDNGDGVIDDLDVPDIVFVAYDWDNWGPGAVTAISGDGSGTHWSLLEVGGHDFIGMAGPAIGDLEGDGSPDVCVGALDVALVCMESDGTFKFAGVGEIPAGGWGYPAIADMDGDGTAEVIYGRQVFDATGNRLGIGQHGVGANSMYDVFRAFGADMDGDGELEVVAGNAVYEMDGTLLWYDGGPDGVPAVADMDGDGEPEVVRVADTELILTETDGTLQWRVPLDGSWRGGAPAIADLDGDGSPEIAVSATYAFAVFEADGTELWSQPTQDNSSLTGCSVFDFEGDGAAEVLYGDEKALWVYDGATGAVKLEEQGHESGTGVEYPVVVDVDADGTTEVVVASNTIFAPGWNGISVIGDADDSWAHTRPIWNQYAYDITGVEDDGSIPATPTPSWTAHNSYRAAELTASPSVDLPEISPGVADSCVYECSEDRVDLYIVVANGGTVASDPVNLVLARSDDGAWVGAQTLPSLDAGTTTLAGPFDLSSEDWGEGTLQVTTDPDGALEECDETDNTLDLGAWPCLTAR